MLQKNWLEWFVFSVSAVILVLVFGFLGYNAITTEGDPPEIEIQLGTPEAHDRYYAIPVTFKNSGGQSIEDVQLDVTLIDNQEEMEKGSVTVPLLPRESSREGWVVFSSDPAEADRIETDIVSYVVP